MTFKMFEWRTTARAAIVGAAMTIFPILHSLPQQPAPQSQPGASLSGAVSDSGGSPAADVTVRVEQKGRSETDETKTDAAGRFSFSALVPGEYLLTAGQSPSRSKPETVVVSSTDEHLTINLRLSVPAAKTPSGAPADSLAQAMEFADRPNFTVAGVTDWTAAGGHGSDVSLRTSEALTRETVTLKPGDKQTGAGEASLHAATSAQTEHTLRAAVAGAPESFDANKQIGEFYLRAGQYAESIPFLKAGFRIHPDDHANEQELVVALEGNGDFAGAQGHVKNLLAHAESADLHRIAGEVDEKLGDPLSAVHEFETAARQDPSETNYFEWGSELLLHRAVWQAQEVFRRGAQAHPKSSRMLTALGAALFAGALYDEAAARLCDASDLNPAGPDPYVFMGRIEMAAPDPLPCIERKLARFAEIEPANALAVYYHAMAIWKQNGRSADPLVLEQVEQMLTHAVTLDPKCADAYLQLGNLSSSRRNYEKAIGQYRKAIDVNPRLSEAHYRLGMAYDRTGDQASARQEFELHDKIEKEQAAEVEKQRKQVKQFTVVGPDRPSAPGPR